MRRILLLCPERVRPIMAGIGIRFYEMARALSGRFDVCLAVPNAPEEIPQPLPFRTARYAPDNLASLAAGCDAVVLHGHVSDPYFSAGIERPLVVDLYDPFAIENLNYFPVLGDEPYRRDRATLERQLRHGDLFLCSSSEQRLFYLGLLFAAGRLNPHTYFDDFQLGNLIQIVPFGVPKSAPPAGGPVVRGVVSGIGAVDPLIFFGGIYDWYDPMLLLAALERLLPEFPSLRVIFCGSPNPETTPQGVYAQVLQQCKTRGWTGKHVFFIPWVAYGDRAAVYGESTIAVATHRVRFETEVSLRTRVLDFLWAGLPTIVTEGGPMSRLFQEKNLGVTVREGDVEGLTRAVKSLLSDTNRREELRRRGREWAADHTWEQVLEPLSRFLESPRRDPHKALYAAHAEHDEPDARPSFLSRVRRRIGSRR